MSRDLYELLESASSKQQNQNSRYVYNPDDNRFLWYTYSDSDRFAKEERKLTLNFREKPIPALKFLETEVSPYYYIEIDRFLDIIFALCKPTFVHDDSNKDDRAEIIKLARSAGLT